MKKFSFSFIYLFLLILNNQLSLSHPEYTDQQHAEHKLVFLTGAAGFIGSNFLKYMFDKYPAYNFIVLDALTYAGSLDNIPDYIKKSERFSFVHGSVTNYNLVDDIMSKAHFVVHFAAETHVTRSIYDDTNFVETDVLGTRVMLSCLVKHRKNIERFIHISTSEVYGTAEFEPMTEEHPLNPRTPYAGAKAGADRLVYSYWCTYDIPALIVRPFNNYGPQQHIEKMIPRFITAALLDKPLTIHGSGSQTRDWVHVFDTCRALDIILHHKDFDAIKQQVIHIGSGKGISVLDIAQKILDHFHVPKSQLHFIHDRPGQVDSHVAAIEKTKKLLNWQPTISLEEGILQTITWYKQNQARWNSIESIAEIPIVVDNIEIAF